MILPRLSLPRERHLQRFWKRLTLCEAMAFTWGAHGTRLQNCFARAKGEAIDMPKACRGGASRSRRAAPPLPTALLLMEKHLLSQWPRAGAVLQTRPVRAQRKSNGEALGKALPQTRAGPHAGSERNVIDHKPFSLAASPMACERCVTDHTPFTSLSHPIP